MNEKIEEDEDPFHDIDLPEDIKVSEWSWTMCCEWIALIILVGGLLYSIIDFQLRKLQIWGLELWRWLVLVLILICGRLFSIWLIHIIIYLLERNFLLKKKVLYFVYALKNDVRNCIWLAFVLLTWNLLFDDDVQNGTSVLAYITKILQCFLIAATLVVVKTFLIKILASSFHMDNYFERIRDSLFNQYVLETLSGLPLHKMQVSLYKNLTNSHQKNDIESHSNDNLEPIPNISYDIQRNNKSKSNDFVINVNKLYKTSQKVISAWGMERLINLVKHYEITTLMEKFDKDILSDDDSILESETTNEYKAKAAAKQIFKNVVKSRCK